MTPAEYRQLRLWFTLPLVLGLVGIVLGVLAGQLLVMAVGGAALLLGAGGLRAVSESQRRRR